MTLLDLWKLIKQYWYLLVICPLAIGLLAAAYAWFFLPNEYTANANLYVLAKNNTETATTAKDLDTSKGSSIASDVIALAKTNRILEPAAQSVGLPSLAGYAVSINPEASSRIVHVNVTASDPEMAANVANAISEQLVKTSVEVIDVEMVNIVEEAKAPLAPSGPNRMLYVLVGILAGGFLALLIICVRDMLDTSIRNAEDASESLERPVMCTVPVISSGKSEGKGAKMAHFEEPELRNACDTLLANIRFSSLDKDIKTVAITSSVPSEGKSTLSANLALRVAAGGKRVLLVECDMRRRTLADRLEISPEHGMVGVLSGSCNISEAIIQTQWEGLYFLDSESNVPNPANLFSSDRFSTLTKMLGEVFDLVIFDTPPLSAFVDAAIIGKVVDGVMMVVREGSTNKKAAQAALSQLETADANIMGLVLTFVNHDRESYYYSKYYYDESGKRVGSKREKR